MALWPPGDYKAVRIALFIVFCFVQASTVTTSLQQLLTLLSVMLVSHIPDFGCRWTHEYEIFKFGTN